MRPECCPDCEGSGQVVAEVIYIPATWSDPPSEDYRYERCDVCEGTGCAIIPVEAVTLEDTTGVLAPEFGMYPQEWPFEPLPETECRPCPVRQFPRILDDWFEGIFASHPKLSRFQ